MSPKRIHREYEIQLSLDNRIRKKNRNHSTDIKENCTKTPKKLPKNLSSPKTPSISPSRWLRIPKTLTMTVKSPIRSQKSNISFESNSSRIKSHQATRSANKSASTISIKQGLRRFSKSPKIILKSPKSKSASKNSQLKKRKSAFTRKSYVDRTANSIDVAASMKLISMKNAFALKEPVVVLQRLPNVIPFAPTLLSTASSLVRTPIKSRLYDSNDNVSSKMFDSVANSLPRITNSSVKRRFQTKNDDKCKIKTPGKLQKIVTVCHSKRSLQNKTTIADGFDNISKISSEPLMSSTPRCKKQLCRMNNEHETIKAYQTRDTTLKSSKCNALDVRQEATITGENEQEGVRGKNETYELIEPQTPNLRKRLREKRSADEKSLNEKAAKKSFNVRFTSPSSDTNCTYSLRSHTSPSRKEQIEDRGNFTVRTNSKQNVARLPVDVFRRRLNSVSNGTISTVESFTPSSQFRRKSKPITNVETPSTLSLNTPAKKPDPKYFAKKKVPNFAEIHKNMFAKSESVVDGKKRLKERHTTLTSLKINYLTRTKTNTKEENRLPNKPSSSPYNRFEFKIRKNDAINSIMRKRNSHSIRNKQQQQNRGILQGVRTNRRFELQMKSRNINL